MRYLPIFYDTKDKKIIIAGGGEIALSKLKILLKTNSHLEVFASKPDPRLEKLASEHRILLTKRKLLSSDLDSPAIVYATYEDEDLNKEIREMGRQAGALVNVVDNAKESDFISPAIVDRDPLIVAIGTEGAAPVLARKIKADLEERLSPNLGLMTRVAKGFREAVEVLPFGRERRDFWSNFYGQNHQSESKAQQSLEDSLKRAQTATPPSGFVSFVGAGPGDPELLTLKARKRIDEADIIIHDRLVSQNILELARREASLFEVGKKGYATSWSQEDINTLIVKHAQRGKLVVRLKGGDASIFGRLDEEIDALNNLDIDYEIVPGITTASAAAASLGQSLTRRGRNSEFRILTARETEGFAEHEWRVLAQNKTTAAIYMGAKAAHFLQGRLLMHGANPSTPITALENVSRPDERLIASSIGSLVTDLETANPKGPVILILGLAPKETNIEEIRYAASL